MTLDTSFKYFPVLPAFVRKFTKRRCVTYLARDGLRGRSRGRVQGVRTPPLPWDDLMILALTCGQAFFFFFRGKEKSQGRLGPPDGRLGERRSREGRSRASESDNLTSRKPETKVFGQVKILMYIGKGWQCSVCVSSPFCVNNTKLSRSYVACWSSGKLLSPCSI